MCRTTPVTWQCPPDPHHCQQQDWGEAPRGCILSSVGGEQAGGTRRQVPVSQSVPARAQRCLAAQAGLCGGVQCTAPHGIHSCRAAEQNPPLPGLTSVLVSRNSSVLCKRCTTGFVLCFGVSAILWFILGTLKSELEISMRERHELLIFVGFFPCKMLIAPISMLTHCKVSSQC